MRSYNLLLDDIRDVREVFPDANPEGFITVRSFKEFTHVVLKLGVPKFISFDNDIGCSLEGTPYPTGIDAAKWLASLDNVNLSKLTFYVHDDSKKAKFLIPNILDDYVKYSSILHSYINEVSIIINHRHKVIRAQHPDFEKAAIEATETSTYKINASDMLSAINKSRRNINLCKKKGKVEMIEAMKLHESSLILRYIGYTNPVIVNKVTISDKRLIYLFSDRIKL